MTPHSSSSEVQKFINVNKDSANFRFNCQCIYIKLSISAIENSKMFLSLQDFFFFQQLSNEATVRIVIMSLNLKIRFNSINQKHHKTFIINQIAYFRDKYDRNKSYKAG